MQCLVLHVQLIKVVGAAMDWRQYLLFIFLKQRNGLKI